MHCVLPHTNTIARAYKHARASLAHGIHTAHMMMTVGDAFECAFANVRRSTCRTTVGCRCVCALCTVCVCVWRMKEKRIINRREDKIKKEQWRICEKGISIKRKGKRRENVVWPSDEIISALAYMALIYPTAVAVNFLYVYLQIINSCVERRWFMGPF